MVVKWPTVPFPGFVLSKHPTFWDSQKGNETQKAARVKESGKRRGKEQEKGLDREMGKAMLMRMPQIKICHIFVPNLTEIFQFARKIAFSVNLRLI